MTQVTVVLFVVLYYQHQPSAFPTDQSRIAFQELKRRFTSAPVLITPDPLRQFVVEVDASNDGVGAVLSQRSAKDSKLHPCAFLSRKLTPAERNSRQQRTFGSQNSA